MCSNTYHTVTTPLFGGFKVKDRALIEMIVDNLITNCCKSFANKQYKHDD